MMTKTAELMLLDETILRFGKDSYLGPWLAEHRDSIAADIRNDFGPDAPMPSEARKVAFDIIAAAKLEAAAIVEHATKRADDMKEVARQTVEARRQEARRHLARLADQV